jgi:hypothetical protein
MCGVSEDNLKITGTKPPNSLAEFEHVWNLFTTPTYLAVPYPNLVNKVVDRVVGVTPPGLTCRLRSVINFRAAHGDVAMKGTVEHTGA